MREMRSGISFSLQESSTYKAKTRRYECESCGVGDNCFAILNRCKRVASGALIYIIILTMRV